MKKGKRAIVLLLLLALPVFAAEQVQYYLELGPTVTYPYHLEGLWPLLNPNGKTHYRFLRNQSGLPLEITHYDSKGRLTPNEEGWAVYKVGYDLEGRIVQSVFYDAKGKMVFNPVFGFASEWVEYDPKGRAKRALFDSKGKTIKTQQKDLSFEPIEPLKND